MVLVLFFIGHIAKGQTFSEWFRQKKTQKKYLAQQITALRVYKGYVKKGWDIAQKGLSVARQFKGGEFNLHELFFHSLKEINPIVKRYPKVGEIIAMQVNIMKLHQQNKLTLQNQGMLTEEELEEVDKAYQRLMKDCLYLVNDLMAVTSSGKMELTDDERINMIDLLHAECLDQYHFAKAYGNEALLFSLNRFREKEEQAEVEWIYGIDKLR
ncbi:hypothetical protein LX66_1913 [Chitinophaga japonensis]|uniref:Uncharacterized protein n=1 Tax=Chitinophaga japonensis TaxID=104662 RepID=A0A562T2P3_CHIJA|nr:hypothetical protein LX66_1913 [Chitinophaga japonensis]